MYIFHNHFSTQYHNYLLILYINAHVNVRVCVRVRVCVSYMYLHICINLCVCKCALMQVARVLIYFYTHLCACAYLCVYMCTPVCNLRTCVPVSARVYGRAPVCVRAILLFSSSQEISQLIFGVNDYKAWSMSPIKIWLLNSVFP